MNEPPQIPIGMRLEDDEWGTTLSMEETERRHRAFLTERGYEVGSIDYDEGGAYFSTRQPGAELWALHYVPGLIVTADEGFRVPRRSEVPQR